MVFSISPSILQRHPGATLWGYPAEEILADQARFRKLMQDIDRGVNRIQGPPPTIVHSTASAPAPSRTEDNRSSTGSVEGAVRTHAVVLPPIAEWYDGWYTTRPGVRQSGVTLPPIREWYKEWYTTRPVAGTEGRNNPKPHENYGKIITASKPSPLQSSLLNAPLMGWPITPPESLTEEIQPHNTTSRCCNERLKRKRALETDDDSSTGPSAPRKVARKAAMGDVKSKNAADHHRPYD
ncbi:hypothetical protein F5Y10DRAFT_260233 [Nemania abortiva]|nr:hypothetical protein F5Y10DRAFT_260233 [Nemania abortiva]